ncbi:MAG: malate dehydrogenase [Candidatus Calescibacterium sp.]|nr:malate dehydrogenase [Candidatus Calescibacterium sp.]MDW8132705.1 malate dehydrogenase [Candidatus Calescibacterium sp.]
MKKISIIGAGNVGATLASLIAMNELADVVMVDVIQDMPKGKALDMMQMLSVFNSDITVKGSNSYEDIKDSDIVVITAGIARKPGMSREDLLNTNANIMKEVVSNIYKYCSGSIVIVVSNPLDVMTYLAYKILKDYGWTRFKVMGMAGVLDSARFKYFISEKLNVSMDNINAFVLGSHGDTMVPIVSFTTVAGVPLRYLIGEEELKQLIERTRNGGAEIVSLLKTGSAYYAPAASTFIMIKSIIYDKKQILPVSVYCQGEYGYEDLVLGLPVVLGKDGIEKIVELNLEQSEKQELDKSAEKIKQLCKELYTLNIV